MSDMNTDHGGAGIDLSQFYQVFFEEAGENLERMEQQLLAIGRALVPLDYTRGDRFDHDPALGLAAWPVLDAIRDLAAAAPGSDDARFAEVSAIRAANRLRHALDTALS